MNAVAQLPADPSVVDVFHEERLADGTPLSAVFAFDQSLFRRKADRDIPVRRMSASGGGRWWTALPTPPLGRSNAVFELLAKLEGKQPV